MYREYRDISINNAVETLCKFSATDCMLPRQQALSCGIMYFVEVLIHSSLCVCLDNDMAGRHRSRNKSIQIIKTATVAAKDCKRTSTIQMHVSNLTKQLLR
jgi:ribosomal protein L20A (L18A)